MLGKLVEETACLFNLISQGTAQGSVKSQQSLEATAHRVARDRVADMA